MAAREVWAQLVDRKGSIRALCFMCIDVPSWALNREQFTSCLVTWFCPSLEMMCSLLLLKSPFHFVSYYRLLWVTGKKLTWASVSSSVKWGYGIRSDGHDSFSVSVCVCFVIHLMAGISLSVKYLTTALIICLCRSRKRHLVWKNKSYWWDDSPTNLKIIRSSNFWMFFLGLTF